MKIQERTGAGGGRSSVPAQPMSGERLPAPPRERKPALAALAVLLILVGALGATMLVLRAGDRIEVVKVTGDIPAGGSVSKANTASVMVADDASIDYIRWEQLAGLMKLKAINAIPAGVVPVGRDVRRRDRRSPPGRPPSGSPSRRGSTRAASKPVTSSPPTASASATGTGSSTGSSGSSSSGASTSPDRGQGEGQRPEAEGR